MAQGSPVAKCDSILIVGAGVFGLSTALELASRGYKNITVLDRHLPPVVDGSSVDISRVIRTDYADPLYAKMATEATEGWRSEYKDYYYNSGFLMLTETPLNDYIEKVKEVNATQEVALTEYPDGNRVREVYPSVQAKLSGIKAYHNPVGGWVDAHSSIRILASRCSLAGVSFICGRRGTVRSLQVEKFRVTGVRVVEGPPITASQVILATGAWTNQLLDLTYAASASGQPVGFIQLTPEEAKTLEGSPIMINLTSGIFCFPPTPGTNILKIARHGYGYTTALKVEGSDRVVSSPMRDGNNARNAFLPQDADRDLRRGLEQLLPQFAKHPWMMNRLCWYTDTPKGDFVVDHHPKLQGLFMATGGAGQ